MSIFREKAPNAMQYRRKILFKSFFLPYNELVRLEFAETKCAKFGTVAKFKLIIEHWGYCGLEQKMKCYWAPYGPILVEHFCVPAFSF